MDRYSEKPATILIVDDIPQNIEIMGSIIADYYNVKVATSGAKALALAVSANPDLIILDIMMPEMDGYEVCTRLKQLPETKDIPVIFVTALTESTDQQKGFDAGCVDYITKPIEPAIALARIRTHLALRSSRQELEYWNNSLQARVLHDHQRQTAQLRLYEMDQSSCNDLLDTTLEEALNLTNSSIGYIYQYDEESRLLTLYSWSASVMPECTIIHKQTVYELDKTGLWGEAVRQRKAIMTNDYKADNPLKKGYPEGHINLFRHLNLPVFRQNRIVAVVGVGNKPLDYTDDDLRQLELFINAAWNIVERKKAQDELLVARKIAEESSRMKSELLANLSHELRTPLNGVIGGAQLLQFTQLTEEQQGYLQMIDESSANELVLVNNLLELVRMESDGIKAEKRLFGLKQCIDESIQLYASAARSKGLSISTLLPFDLPETVLGDRTRISQILHCLLGNAIKFTDYGSVTVKLESEPAGADRLLAKFSVIDTGTGIEADKLEKIFELFIQSDMSNTRRFGGLGLGLAVCKRLAVALGGKITVKSVPGSGSTFSFELPLELVANTEEKKYVPAGLNRKLDILVAEDDRLTAMTTAALLKKMGHNVQLAVNGAEALNILKMKTPDLVLMDLQMPVMNGFEALQGIRKLEKEQGRNRIPVIAQTTYARWNYHESFLSAEFDGFIAKPLIMSELQSVISGCAG